VLSGGWRTWRRPGWPSALLTGGDLVYELPIPPSEVAERLARPLRDEDMRHRYTATGQLTGWVFPSRVFLELYRGSRHTEFEGEIVEAPGGRRVAGTVKISLAVFRIVFAIAWTALAGVLSTVISAIVTHGFSTAWSSAGPPLLVVLLLPAFGPVLLIAGPAGERGAQEVLVKRLDALLGVDASAVTVRRGSGRN
jgi:hypothetical protein